MLKTIIIVLWIISIIIMLFSFIFEKWYKRKAKQILNKKLQNDEIKK